MTKAFTIYIDDESQLVRICGTFLVETNNKTTSANCVNEALDGNNAVYFPDVATNKNLIKYFKEDKK